jgi:hypothetical protein
VDRLLAQVVSRALRRGMRSDPMWLVVGVAGWLVLRARSRPDPLYWSGRIEPGERIEISTFDPFEQASWDQGEV